MPVYFHCVSIRFILIFSIFIGSLLIIRHVNKILLIARIRFIASVPGEVITLWSIWFNAKEKKCEHDIWEITIKAVF